MQVVRISEWRGRGAPEEATDEVLAQLARYSGRSVERVRADLEAGRAVHDRGGHVMWRRA